MARCTPSGAAAGTEPRLAGPRPGTPQMKIKEAGMTERTDKEPTVRTGAEQPWDPEDLTIAKGQDPTPANVERSRRELAEEGPAAIEKTVP